MHRFIARTFVKGFSLVIPLSLSIWFLQWLASTAENRMSSLLIRVLPIESYIPGMGIIALLLVVFFLGLLMYPWMTRTLLNWLDSHLRDLPLFGSVYSPLKDLMDVFGGDFGKELGQPVMIRVPNTTMDTLGFITREGSSDLPEGLVPEGHVAVYVQWSSQIGGYCFIVPREDVRELDMSVEDGMKWALTAGLSVPGKSARSLQTPSQSPPS